jgi:hypothetical protein
MTYFVDPQKTNFYSYVQDNPLKYTDPDGKQLVAQAAVVASFTDPLTALIAVGGADGRGGGCHQSISNTAVT